MCISHLALQWGWSQPPVLWPVRYGAHCEAGAESAVERAAQTTQRAAVTGERSVGCVIPTNGRSAYALLVCSYLHYGCTANCSPVNIKVLLYSVSQERKNPSLPQMGLKPMSISFPGLWASNNRIKLYQGNHSWAGSNKQGVQNQFLGKQLNCQIRTNLN